MATIHPHGKGFRVHFSRDGAKRKSETFQTREAAEEWMRINLPATLDGSMLHVIDLWRAESPTPYREDTADRLENLVRRRGWTRPERLTLTDFKVWVREDPAWRRPCQYLRTVLRWARDELRLPIRSEILEWSPPKQMRKAKPALLTDQQAENIRFRALELGPRAFAVVDYLMTYGARPITACRLRVSDLDVERCELVLGQMDAAGRSGEKHSGGWRHRVMEHHLGMWQELTQGLFYLPAAVGTNSVPLFPHYKEDRPWRIDRGRASELDSWYVNRIGRPLGLDALKCIYHLKRYAITRLFRTGSDPATIALFTGHLDSNQLMTYAVSNADQQDDALARLAKLGSQGGSQVPKKSA